MRKNITAILLICILITALLPLSAFSKTGDVIGHAKYTDISAYINHYPITSYNINDYTAVVAEDLQNYGFKVVWNGNDRSLSITRDNDSTKITPYGTVYKYTSKAGQNSFPYLETDIVTYVNGNKVESFNINGKTCVYIDSLAPYGEVVWIPETRAIKMWVDGLPIKDYAPIDEWKETTSTVTTTTPVNNSTPNIAPKLHREDIEITLNPNGSSAIFVNKSSAPFSFSSLSVNGGIILHPDRFEEKIVVGRETTKYVDWDGNFTIKGANLGVNSYGSVVIEWNGKQYYADFTVNGITTFYRGNARGPISE